MSAVAAVKKFVTGLLLWTCKGILAAAMMGLVSLGAAGGLVGERRKRRAVVSGAA
ncbi:hypothetical protein ACIRVK_19320 [Streptomyces sp. NPDC101152]|uniref:hypothetical protein n=1 Tax=Streptomyces sp. NPDC101152 TaxID=3366116 RepID=UPI0038105997